MLAGLVLLNGTVVRDLGHQIDPEKDKIAVREPSRVLRGKAWENKITLAFYKPRDFVSGKNEKEGRTVFELLPQFKNENLNTVGRLDKDSEGLILLSNDGIITSVVTGDDHLIEKEYVVKVREHLRPNMIQKMSQGIMLEDGPTLKAKTDMIDDYSFRISLKEGRKHQIRRMAAALKLTVTNLKRVRIGDIKLGNLKPGSFRILNETEVQKLKRIKFKKFQHSVKGGKR